MHTICTCLRLLLYIVLSSVYIPVSVGLSLWSFRTSRIPLFVCLVC